MLVTTAACLTLTTMVQVIVFKPTGVRAGKEKDRETEALGPPAPAASTQLPARPQQAAPPQAAAAMANGQNVPTLSSGGLSHLSVSSCLNGLCG